MKRTVTLIAFLLLLVPSSALAASSSTCQAYNPQVCQVKGNSASRTTAAATSTTATPAATTTTSASTLPFTGLDVIFLAAGGGTLLGAGLVVRRLSRGA
jgi:hypothetical protein